MATITVSAAGVTRYDALLGRQGNDSFTIAGDSTTTMLIDQDTRFGTPLTPWAGALGQITPSTTVGGSWVLEGRYVRIIPYNTGTGNVPPAGVTITQGGASGKLIGVYSALNVSPESVGAAMPASGFIKIKEWNDVAYTASALTIPNTTGSNLVPANISGFEGTLAATDMTITAGTAVLTNSSTVAQAGTKSLRIAPSATTTTVVKAANGTRFLVGAGLAVTVSAYMRGSDVKSCTVDIEWFDSTNTSISTTAIQTQNISTSAWTQFTAAAVTAPANTRWASVNFTVTSPTSGQFYYVDTVTVTPGNWTTGATATAADRVGWIEPVSVETLNQLITAAGQTYFSDRSFCKGSWYEIGTTDGNRATTYQIPTNGGLSYHGGVLVDKAAAVNISSASWSGGVATFNTSAAHGLTTGDRVFIGGVLPRLYTSDINNIEACTVVDSDTFTIPMTSDPGTYTSGGTVAAVEWYPTTTNLNTTIRTEAVPGKVCWLDSATGLLRFGNDNVTSTGGYCPATGLKVRIPNVMTAAVATGYATPLTNALAAVSANRVKFYAGTTVGKVVASQMSGTWNTTVIQTGEYCTFNDCVWVGLITISSQQAVSTITFNCTGGNAASTLGALVVNTHSTGVTIQDCTLSVGDVAASVRTGASFSNTNNITFTNNKIIGTGTRAAGATVAINMNVGSGLTATDTTIVNCGGIMNTSQFRNASITDTRFWGSGAGYVPVAANIQMLTFTNVSTDWVIDGVYADQPGPFQIMRNNFATTASGCDNIVIRNIGTYASPIETGSAMFYDKAFTRSTTTATVTHVAHGFETNQPIMVNACTDISTSPVSSGRAAIIAGVKLITVTGPDTFTFTCLNAGPASGTIDYYACGSTAVPFSITTKNVDIQNVHILGGQTTGMSGAATADGVRFKNCSFEYRFNGSTLNRSSNNQVYTSGSWTTYEYAQPSTGLGIHYSDHWVRDIATPGVDAVVSGATWTRVTTTATVIKANHGLTDSARIYVENSSNQTAIPTGVKELGVVVVDKNTFTLTCVNSGTTSGTLDYRLPGDGYLLISTNNVSADTTSYVTRTGTASFTGASSLYVPAVNDSVVWETPEYMLGWDHFANFPPYIYGNTVTDSNYDLFYQINTGSGYSAYKNFAYKRAGAGGSAASTTVTMTSTTGVAVDDYVYGIGVAGGAKVVSIDSGTNITVTVANTGTVSGTLVFNYSPNEATFPATGIKLKTKIVTNTTNVGAIYNIFAGLVSTASTRAVLYNQATQYTLTLSGLQTGSDISIRPQNTVGSNLVNVDANAGTTYDYTYYYAPGTYVDIAIYKAGYKVFEVVDYLLDDADVTYPVSQLADLEYA